MPRLLRIITFFVVSVFLMGTAFVSANASARKFLDGILSKLSPGSSQASFGNFEKRSRLQLLSSPREVAEHTDVREFKDVYEPAARVVEITGEAAFRTVSQDNISALKIQDIAFSFSLRKTIEVAMLFPSRSLVKVFTKRAVLTNPSTGPPFA